MASYRYKCSASFESQYAYVDGIDDPITITEFLKEHNTKPPRCVPHKHELIGVECTQRKSYFRHRCATDVDKHNFMTKWHSEWQSNFPYTEISFCHRTGQLKDRRADVHIPEHKHILEFQHSTITSEEVNNRMHDYALHDHTVSWLIDAQDNINVARVGQNLMLHFKGLYWMYESFMNCPYVYYDIKGFIYKVNPALVRSHQVNVREPVSKTEFISAMKSNSNVWDIDEPVQCRLYVKQQGAGSGKTYGLMQMLNNDSDMAHFKYIVFLTKQHSAVHVMYNEFIVQYEANLLSHLDDAVQWEDGKKKIVEYTNTQTGIRCIAIFATVDSFTYAVGDTNVTTYDKFAGIVSSIKDGFIRQIDRSGTIRYAGVNPSLNKEMLIIIDETQDLNESYGEAFLRIVKEKHTSLCVVGDRLQSLAFSENALTYLQDAAYPFMKTIKSDASNSVRRFSHPTLIDLVNRVVPFDKYDLPNMISAEDVRSQDITPLTIFQGGFVNSKKTGEDESIIAEVSAIMTHFEREVLTQHRVPEDFMVITPFTSMNPLADTLELALNQFWKHTMEKNETYIKTVKNVHPYWKDIDTQNFVRYAIFHKSEEGGSINLSESDRATRMVSIHSSKGDGRKVVFCIGLSESALRKFSKVSDNLIYNSLLHVALTRQKERLYLRMNPTKDDIHRRIKPFATHILGDVDKLDIRNNFKLYKLIDNYNFEEFREHVIVPYNPASLEKVHDEKLLIDMGDHNIRYASMFMNIIIHFCNSQRACLNTKKQLYAILQNITQNAIKPVGTWKEYHDILSCNKDVKMKRDKTKTMRIPLLYYSDTVSGIEYGRYYKIISKIMESICTRISTMGSKDLKYLCPLESVIFYYMIECIENNIYQDITCDDLYNIVDIYDKIFGDVREGHDACQCRHMFVKTYSRSQSSIKLKYKTYLANHYNSLQKCIRYVQSIEETHSNINWLYSHPVVLHGGYKDCENEDFKVSTNFDLIGYNDTHVIVLYIKPQLNELNYNELMQRSVYDAYLIANSKQEQENHARFTNKNIVSYVISLNSELYCVNWTETVNSNISYIANQLRDAIRHKCCMTHSQLYDIYTSCEFDASNISKYIESFRNIVTKKIDEDAPVYIDTVVRTIENEFEDVVSIREKQEIHSKYLVLDNFMRLMEKHLDRSLRKYLPTASN